MKPLRIKITDRKSYQIEGTISKNTGKPVISIWQMYTTAKEPNDWKPSRYGLIIEPENLQRVIKALTHMSTIDIEKYTNEG